MIIVKVELQSAFTGKTTELAVMHIINDGTGTETVGQYDVLTYRKGTQHIVQRRGNVVGHRRLDQHVWNLVHKALVAVGYGKE